MSAATSGGWGYEFSSTSATSPSIASPRPCSLIASDRVEGTAVYDAKRIGKVERLVIDKASGCVAYAPEFRGLPRHRRADHYRIPWPMLDYDEKLGGYRVDITEEQLKNAPKIEQGESWEQTNGNRGEGVHGYWEQPAPVQERQTSSLITSDRVEGMPVYDARGKRIGKVERLMIDKLTGRIAYAILSFGDFLGIGEDHYPIPWSMLTMKSPTASNWTSPKSNLRTPRRSTRGKLGANESGPQPGRLRLLGSQILLACGIGGIGHSNSVLNGAQ
jgi:sporulation protein YlmC with PRC-barrel domain